MLDQRARILPPYTRRVNDMRHLVSKVVVVTTLILFAMLMGFFIAVFGLSGWFIPTVPLALMFGVALWMAPDIDPHFDKAIKRGYFIFMAIFLIWPGYLAFNAPGLPWISFARLTMFALMTIFFMQLAMSRRFRNEIHETFASNIWMTRFFLGWIAITLVMSAAAGFSNADRDINMQIMWHLPMIMTAWIMRADKNPMRFFYLMIAYILVTAAVTIPEFRQGMPIWAPHIPAWLMAEDSFAAQLLDGSRRFDIYRVKSIYLVSVAYAEFIGMSVPFVLLGIIHAKSFWRAALAFALLLLLFTAAWLTNSRTALAVFVATIPAFVLLWAVRRYRLRRTEQDIISTAVLWAYPAFAMALALAVTAVPRIRVRVLGGSGTQNSDDARAAQWDMAIAQLLQNPLGYGSGSLAERVPYTNPAGDHTVDSYPINLLIEHGVIGFILFAGFFLIALYTGARAYIFAKDEDELVAGAAALSILSFLVSRTILSMEAGIPLAFVMAGLILAIHWRQQKRMQAEAPRPATAALSRRYEARGIPVGAKA